jgi:branched-chain amino acid transport system permease protein
LVSYLKKRTGDQWAFIIVVVIIAIVPSFTQFGTINTLANIAVLGVAVLGMNLVLGIGGQFWLGQSALFALGAYGTGVLTVQDGWSFWPALIVVCLVTAAVGAVLGIPGLRLGGFYLALSTFFFASIVPELIDALSSKTGGEAGLVGIPTPQIGGFAFGIKSLYALAFIVLLIVFLLNFSLLRAQWGRVLLVMGHDENLAQSVGIRLWKSKMLVYFVGAGIVGVSGALYAAVNTAVLPSEVSINLTITFLAAVVIGGAGTLAGPLVGIALLQWLPTLLTGLQTYTLIGYGVVLFLVMVLAPEGLVPTARRLVAARVARGKRSAERGTVAQAAPDVTAPEAIVVDGGAPAAMTNGGAPAPEPRTMPTRWADLVQNADSDPGSPILSVDSVSKSFGGVRALNDVSLSVGARSLCAIIGPNGSGKTTLLNVITGFYPPESGTVSVGGRQIGKLGPHGISAKLGVRRSFQTAAIVPTLTVIENVLLGQGMPANNFVASCVTWPTARRQEREARRHAREVLAFVGLAGLEDAAAVNLPAGQRRLLEVARSLIELPRLLLLDEPSSGLNPSETIALGDLLHAVVGLGVAVVAVEHNMNFVLRYASSVAVLDQGVVVASGGPDEIARDPEVKKAYLGSQVAI